MDEENNKIDPFDPLVIIAFVLAFIGDITFFFVITHWVAGAIALAILWPRFKGFLPKIIFVFCVAIPALLLMIGIVQGILLSNKLIRFLAEQVAIQALAVATGGVGELAEAGVAGETAASVAEAAAEGGAKAAAEAGASAAAEGGEAAAKAAPRGGRPSETSIERKPEASRPSDTRSTETGEVKPEGGSKEPEISKEALGEEPTPFEKLKKLTEEMPGSEEGGEDEEDEDAAGGDGDDDGESGSRDGDRKDSEDIRKKLDRYGIQEKGTDSGETLGEEEENEDLPKAA